MTLRDILLFLCVLFLGLAALPWLQNPMPDAPQPQPATAAQTPADFNNPGPLADYDEITRRPVFVASRRPPLAVQPQASTNGEVLLLDRYPVIGVVIAGGRGIVLIRKAAGDTVSRIEQGAEIDGWTLREVSRERLVLEMAGSRKEVILQKNNSAD